MATRLRISDIVGNYGTEYTIEIDDTQFTGAVTEGDCYAPAFELSWDSPSGESNLGGVMGSSANINLVVDSVGAQELVDDMTNGVEGRFTVRILRKQVAEAERLFWVGYVITDASEGIDEDRPYPHKIACVDGLAALKKKDYSNGVAVQPQRTILGHLLEILSYINTTSIYYAADANYIGTSMKWRCINHGTPAANFCPSAHTRVAGEVFAKKDDKTGQYTFMDCLSVLNAICEVFRARIYYSDGIWRFEQLNAREAGSWTVRVFDKNANFKSGGTFGNTQFPIVNNINGAKLEGMKYTWFAPLREVTATYEHRTFVNWLAGQSWRWGNTSLGGEYDVFGFTSISLDGAYGIISGAISYKVTGGSSGTPFRVIFGMTVKADTTTLDRNSSVVPNTNIIQLDAPVWLGTSNVAELSTGFIFQGSQEGELTFSIYTPVFPNGSEDIKIDFEQLSILDANGNNVFATVDNWDTKNLVLQIVNSSSSENFYDTKKYTATGNPANSEKVEIQPLFGQALQSWTPTKMQVRNGPAGVWVDSEADWQHQSGGSIFAIEELVVREILTAHVSPRKRLQGTVLGRYLDAHATMFVDAQDEFWVFLGGTYNPDEELLDGEWFLQGYDDNIIEPDNPGGGVIGVGELDSGEQVPQIQALPPNGQTVVGSVVGQPLNADSNIALAALATNYANTAITAGAITSLPLRFPAKANSYLPGDDIMLLNPQTGKISTLTVTTANAEGATSLAVSGTIDVDYPGGSFVIYSALNKFTQQGAPSSPNNISATLTGPGSVSIGTGKWSVSVAIKATTPKTVNVGSVASGNQYGDAVAINTTYQVVACSQFEGSLHFSGFSGDLTVNILVL
jgi:hypothetical protein